MKLTYLILTFPFSTNCGGIVVLHKLCHLMRKLGHDAYLWFPEGRSHVRNPDYDTPIGNPNGAGREGAIDPRDCCVIYPEIVHGNPLEAKVPVTWLLYHTGDNDTNRIKVAYDPLYAANHRDAERLTVVETFPEHCRLPTPDELSANPREGACFVVRKGTGTPRIPETENGRAVEITNTTVENATAVFRRSFLQLRRSLIPFDPGGIVRMRIGHRAATGTLENRLSGWASSLPISGGIRAGRTALR
jgi:hypothetical protein